MKRSRYKERYHTSWAVLIGIDCYADSRHQTLRFAVADAVAMARSLIEHWSFEPENVFVITEPAVPLRDDLRSWLKSNEGRLRYQPSATKQHIEELLFNTLTSMVGADDCVLIYFAGHGLPRADGGDLRNARPYLVPADAEFGRWRDHIDLHDLLNEGNYLAAKHVLYVLDACCSGLANQRSIEQPKLFVQKMLYRKARQCLTAGTREQRVDDGCSGQHSPFTGKLLGLLDRTTAIPGHEPLTVSLIAAALRKGVGGIATISSQLPALFPTTGDRDGEFVFFPRAASLSLDDQVALARLLVDEVGRVLDEPAPIMFAAKLWRRILDSATAAPSLRLEAQREHARTQLLLRNTRKALSELDATALDQDADARLLRAMAHMRLDEPEQAAVELEKLVDLAPDHRYADWARCVIPIARQDRGRRHALLIGVDHIASIRGSVLRGCANDVAAMQEMLRELGFTKVITLIGANATILEIRRAFQQLAHDIRPEDSFVCYVSGPGSLHRGRLVYPSHDLDLASNRMLTEDDIDQAMQAISADDKLLIADGCYLAPIEGDEHTDYRFLHACRRDELSWETTDDRGTYRGAFTYALEKAVRASGDAPIEQLMERIRAELTHHQQQRPGYTGSGAAKLSEPHALALEIINLAEQSHRPFTHARINQFARRLDNIEQLAAKTDRAVSLAPLWLAIGRAQLAWDDGPRAMSALCRTADPAALLPLLRAQLLCNCFAEALDTWTRWRAAHPAPAPVDQQHAVELGSLLAACQTDTRRALLVATDDDNAPTTATEILRRARHALIDRFGVPSSNILEMANASKDALVSAFDAVIDGAQDAPVFFLFIGPGFDSAEIWLSTMDADGHASANLCLSELRSRAAQCLHLTSALLITRSERPAQPSRTSGQPQPAARDQAELGITTLVVAPHIHRDITSATSILDVEGLIEVLDNHGHARFTLDDWRRKFDDSHGSRLRGNADAALLPYTAKRARMLELVRNIQQGALSPAFALLERLTKQPEDATEAWLQIAILQAQREHHREAETAIKESLKHRPADEIDQTNRAQPTTAASDTTEAHYHYGRILFALKEYTAAEVQLRLTVEAEPEHARAHLYRALVIRELIATDLEKLRRESFRQYIKYGAPHGMDDVTTEQRLQAVTGTRVHEEPRREEPAEVSWRTR